LSTHAALVSGNPLRLKMVTLKRDVPPDAMDIGAKLLLISAGTDMICADAVCAGVTRMDTISAAMRKGMSDLRIFILCLFD